MAETVTLEFLGRQFERVFAELAAIRDEQSATRGDLIADDPAEQARQALRNIAAALAEAGAGLGDVVRVRYYLPEFADWPRIAAVLGEAFGAIRPAATALVCGLVDPRMKIEIEVTARRRDTAPPPAADE
jgi:enamine deaminase RidA (YjgF/YER057c/UK114 family)